MHDEMRIRRQVPLALSAVIRSTLFPYPIPPPFLYSHLLPIQSLSLDYHFMAFDVFSGKYSSTIMKPALQLPFLSVPSLHFAANV
jgi:hypothetical protein